MNRCALLSVGFLLFLAAACGPDPMPPDYTAPDPGMTEAELDQIIENANPPPRLNPVVQGKALALPDDAVVDGLVMRTSRPRLPEGVKPIPLPIYMIFRDGKQADVSRETGEFMIREGDEKTFQFLIDQLGRDKMLVLPDETSELRRQLP